jgi:hypothetical protein
MEAILQQQQVVRYILSPSCHSFLNISQRLSFSYVSLFNNLFEVFFVSGPTD